MFQIPSSYDPLSKIFRATCKPLYVCSNLRDSNGWISSNKLTVPSLAVLLLFSGGCEWPWEGFARFLGGNGSSSLLLLWNSYGSLCVLLVPLVGAFLQLLILLLVPAVLCWVSSWMCVQVCVCVCGGWGWWRWGRVEGEGAGKREWAKSGQWYGMH